MRVAAYVRVSTDEQAEKGNSINEQQERLSAYCRAMGWSQPDFFIDDGYSAKNLKRPAVYDLIKRVEKSDYNVIVATKLDRVCRNLLDLLNLVEVFEKYDCRFVSASESFDTSTAAGRMTLHLLGMFAQFERERISERVKDNMVSIARNTDKALGLTCYGYKVENDRIVIDEYEAQHVRFMFELAENGHGTRHIAMALNQRGIKTRKGALWEARTVQRLMTNQALIGTRIFNMRKNVKGSTKIRDESEWIVKENNHEPIISKEQFETVQTLFNSRKPGKVRAENESYLLSGILICKQCGRRMKGSTARHKYVTYYRYICASYTLGTGCKMVYVHRDEIEKFVIEQIQIIAQLSDEQIEQMLGKSRSNDDDLKVAYEQLARVDKRMQKQIEAYENDLISAHDLKLARERIETERSKIKAHIKELESRNFRPDEIRGNVNGQLEDVLGTDRQKAKKSMSLLIDQILVDPPNVDIVWRL